MNFKTGRVRTIYLALFLLVFSQTIEESGLANITSGSYMNVIVNVCRFLLLIACIINNRHFSLKPSRLMFLAAFFVAVFLDLYNGSMTFFDVFAVAIMVPELDYYRTLQVFFHAVLSAFIIIVLFSFTGILPETSFYRGDVVRNTLGFQHPNLLAINVMALVILFILTRKRTIGEYNYATSESQIDIFDIALCLISAVFCYVVSNSLTETIVLVFVALVFGFSKVRKYFGAKELARSKIFKICIFMLIPVLALLLYYIVTNSRSDLIPEISDTFYNRYLYALFGYNIFGIHLLGVPQDAFTTFKVTTLAGSDIDCLYMKILIRYGILLSCYFLFICIICVRKYINKKNNIMLLVIVCMAIFSIFENRVLANSKFSFIFVCAFAQYSHKNTLKRYP